MWVPVVGVKEDMGIRNSVSLFAGCGGSSLGYSTSGFREVFAIDRDEDCRASLHLNFPSLTTSDIDISTTTPKDVMEAIGVGVREIDLLDGSPPCQGFSTAGKRRLDDPRNSLVMKFAELITGIMPAAAVMENVMGMIRGPFRWEYCMFHERLRKAGYRTYGKILNAANHGVSQARRRIFVVAIRDDNKNIYSFPLSKPVMTLREVLVGCPNGPYPRLGPTALKVAMMLAPGEGGQGIWPGNKFAGFSTKRLRWDKPSVTLTAEQGSRSGLIHPDEDRCLTLPEMLRIQGFPDSWKLAGILKSQIKQIGNAVPPPLAEDIGRSIMMTLQDME